MYKCFLTKPWAGNGNHRILNRLQVLYVRYKFLAVSFVVSFCAIVSGCGKSETTPTTAQTANPASPMRQAISNFQSASKDDAIATVVSKFFEAVRASDNQTARAHLTPAAVQRMEQLGLDFILPISKAAQFKIGSSQLLDESSAAVDTIWTEPDAEGKLQQEPLTVVLKRRDLRWEIMAVFTDMGDASDGIVFEAPNKPFSFSLLEEKMDPQSQTVPQQANRPAVQDPFRQ